MIAHMYGMVEERGTARDKNAVERYRWNRKWRQNWQRVLLSGHASAGIEKMRAYHAAREQLLAVYLDRRVIELIDSAR